MLSPGATGRLSVMLKGICVFIPKELDCVFTFPDLSQVLHGQKHKHTQTHYGLSKVFADIIRRSKKKYIILYMPTSCGLNRVCCLSVVLSCFKSTASTIPKHTDLILQSTHPFNFQVRDEQNSCTISLSPSLLFSLQDTFPTGLQKEMCTGTHAMLISFCFSRRFLIADYKLIPTTWPSHHSFPHHTPLPSQSTS